MGLIYSHKVGQYCQWFAYQLDGPTQSSQACVHVFILWLSLVSLTTNRVLHPCPIGVLRDREDGDGIVFIVLYSLGWCTLE